MASNSDTPEAQESGGQGSPVPASGEKPKVTAAEIARAWGTSRAYVSMQIKKGCPNDSIEAATQWRKEHSVYGVGYRSKKANSTAPASAPDSSGNTSTQDTLAGETGRARCPREDVNVSAPYDEAELLPFVVDLNSLHASLVGAINMELAAYRNAKLLRFAEAAIRAYNNARDGRFAAERAYREEMERRRILVPLDEAMRLSRKGYDVLRPALLAMGARIASNCNPDNPALAATEIDREVSAIMRQAESAYALPPVPEKKEGES